MGHNNTKHNKNCKDTNGQILSLSNAKDKPGNTKGGSITVPLTSCLIGLESAV
jgi:hypothetical protein